MSVLLIAGNPEKFQLEYDQWVSIGHVALSVSPEKKELRVEAQLEIAFDECADTWMEIGKALAQDPSSLYAHTPSCVANVSDFGLMLAWTKLIDEWSNAAKVTLVICSDPWMFRHLSARPGVKAMKPPNLFFVELKLMLRGYAARIKAAFSNARAAVSLRWMRAKARTGCSALLVYGHPRSDGTGKDGYFGDLMVKADGLYRVLHVDCPPRRAKELIGDDRTLSLHAWGNPFHALTLPFKHWAPEFQGSDGSFDWLVRRAKCLEAGSGQGAMIAWQIHCQARWLESTRPYAVTWPWENHSWERAFVRVAGRTGTRTIAYQHSVIGRQMLNYSARSNGDGLSSIPNSILCTGEATRQQLLGWDIPEERLSIGGAWRFPERAGVAYDPDAPVFMALPFDQQVAAEMLEAAKGASAFKFIIKDHPMAPFKFSAQTNVQPTDIPLTRQPVVSAVVFAATTVGLEAILAGLPTLRFRPSNRIALDILPAGISVPASDQNSLASALQTLSPQEQINRNEIFAKPDIANWSRALFEETRHP
jgi:hypothetical protein